MKAITICQPYAHLICLPPAHRNHKRVENRTWNTGYRGPLLIHAGKSQDWLAIETEPGVGPWDANYEIPLASMAFGAIVGKAELIDCLPYDAIERGHYDQQYPWLRAHQHTNGPWCLVLGPEVERFPQPIPWRGQQMMFDVDWPPALAQESRTMRMF